MLAEREFLLAHLTMWMPISVHFRRLQTEQHKNFLTAWPDVIRLSFWHSSLPLLTLANQNKFFFIILQTSSWSELFFLSQWWCTRKPKLFLQKLHAADTRLENEWLQKGSNSYQQILYCINKLIVSELAKLKNIYLWFIPVLTHGKRKDCCTEVPH